MSYACYCDYDPADVYVASRHKAAKPHRCEECAGAIKVGDVYERASMLYDGSWSTYLTCGKCVSAREWLQAHVPCFCWAHGSLQEDIRNTLDEYAHEAPGLLFGTLRRAIAGTITRSQP